MGALVPLHVSAIATCFIFLVHLCMHISSLNMNIAIPVHQQYIPNLDFSSSILCSYFSHVCEILISFARKLYLFF